MIPVALGLRAHSGWAVAVAVSGGRRSPEVRRRVRIEMVNRASPGGKQPYHYAEPMPFDAAEELIARATESADRLAGNAVEGLISELRSQGYETLRAGLLTASGRPLGELRSILASHAAIHSAEGELYRNALAQACAQCGIACDRNREKEIMEVGSKVLGISPEKLGVQLTELGRSVGRPWTQDEKLATLAAWLTLGLPGTRQG